MTVLVAIPERTASRVVDALSNRDVRTESTIADARAVLVDEPALVLVSARLDGESTDLLAAVRSGEHCDPDTPVLELVVPDDADTDDGAADADADTAETDLAGTDTTDTTGSTTATSGDSASSSTGTTIRFDDRVSLADPDALRAVVRLALAVSEYREATTQLYALSRRRSDGESIDPAAIDDARRVANDRLTTVQRAVGGRTPFRRLLSE